MRKLRQTCPLQTFKETTEESKGPPRASRPSSRQRSEGRARGGRCGDSRGSATPRAVLGRGPARAEPGGLKASRTQPGCFSSVQRDGVRGTGAPAPPALTGVDLSHPLWSRTPFRACLSAPLGAHAAPLSRHGRCPHAHPRRCNPCPRRRGSASRDAGRCLPLWAPHPAVGRSAGPEPAPSPLRGPPKGTEPVSSPPRPVGLCANPAA